MNLQNTIQSICCLGVYNQNKEFVRANVFIFNPLVSDKLIYFMGGVGNIVNIEPDTDFSDLEKTCNLLSTYGIQTINTRDIPTEGILGIERKILDIDEKPTEFEYSVLDEGTIKYLEDKGFRVNVLN